MPEVKVLDSSRRTGGLWVSAISVWEIGVLQQIGRIRLSTPFRAWVQRALDAPGIRFAPLGAAAAAESTLLPGEAHADPADRFLIATARVERLALATRDDRILEYSRKGFVRSLAI
jgi:PIN domain nuclease of toxin-antitoxin system